MTETQNLSSFKISQLSPNDTSEFLIPYEYQGLQVLESIFPEMKSSKEGQFHSINDLMRILSYFFYDDLDKFAKVNEFAKFYFHARLNSTLDPMSYLLDPALTPSLDLWNAENLPSYSTALSNLTYTNNFKEIISHLWYSKLPCFDIQNLTALGENDSSFIKNCMWKGVSVLCASIFLTIPTDSGMCCSFNMAAAEDVFTDSLYSQTITNLQSNDVNNTFRQQLVNSQPPIDLSSKAGTNMGLEVTLDAHTDLMDAFSIQTNYDSFTVLVGSPADFPLTNQRGFRVKRGFHNMVALSGTIISADDSLRSVIPDVRGCLFTDEYSLKLYKSYSQANCLFECTLSYSQEIVRMENNNSMSCTPWFYPFVDDEQNTCNPWLGRNIYNHMEANVPDDKCSYCLPDCNNFVYRHTLSHEPFRPCDDFNFGITPLCNLENQDPTYKPVLWGEQVISQLTSVFYGDEEMPSYISQIPTNKRVIRNAWSLINTTLLSSTATEYDAYQRDIAVVSVYFDSPTVWEFATQASSTWIVFFGNVGGLYGLCIGFSIATVVELVWLMIRIVIETDILGAFKITRVTNQ